MPQANALGDPLGIKRRHRQKNRSRTEAVDPSSQANPITRPIAPHLVVLGGNVSAGTAHMELLKLPFRFE